MHSLSLSIEEVKKDSEIDRFVNATEGGSLFHTTAWLGVIEKQGYPQHHLVGRNGSGEIVLFCPFFLSHIPNAPAFVAHSIPHSEIGGPVLSASADTKDVSAAMTRAMKSGALSKRIISYTLVTSEADLCSRLLPHSTVESPGSYFAIDLKSSPPDKIWDEVFTRDGRQRNNIRKLEKDSVKIKTASESDFLEFHKLYWETVDRAGGTPYSSSFFMDIWEAMSPKNFSVLVAIRDGNIVGGSAFLHHPEKSKLWMLFGGYKTQIGVRNTINLFTWWNTLLWAKDHGYETVHLGTNSTDPKNSNFRFKKQFAPQITTKYFVRQSMIPESTIRLAKGVRNLIVKARTRK